MSSLPRVVILHVDWEESSNSFVGDRGEGGKLLIRVLLTFAETTFIEINLFCIRGISFAQVDWVVAEPEVIFLSMRLLREERGGAFVFEKQVMFSD